MGATWALVPSTRQASREEGLDEMGLDLLICWSEGIHVINEITVSTFYHTLVATTETDRRTDRPVVINPSSYQSIDTQLQR
jgi:hypothetical protein